MWQIISNILGNILVAIGVFLFAKIVLNESVKVTKIRLVVDFILSIISYTIIMIYFTGTAKTIFMGITMILFDKDIFKSSMSKMIFLTFIYMLVLIIPEVIQLFFITKVLDMSKEFCYTFAGSVLSNGIMLILLIIITFILKKILRKIINMDAINNQQLIILTILTLVSILISFYSIIRKFKTNDDVIIYIVSMCILAFVLFSLIKQIIINNKLTKEYDNLLEFMTTYENEIEKQRILRHEIKNEFRTIRAKICDQQENKEIIEYIDEIVNDKYEMDKEKYAKFGYLPPNGIKGLCYFKMQEAENNGINVDINISKKIKESTIYKLNIKEERDFGRILGVFLDNAIEASKDTKKKQLGIEGYVNSNQEFKMIITNTYDNKIDKSKIGMDKFSTKGKNRGHGLLLVKQLKEKNKKFEIKTDIQEKIYIQTIEIKKL